MNGRIFRSRNERALGGVAAGLAHHLGADVALVRLILIVGTPLTGGLVFVAYLAAWAALPLEPGMADTAATTFGTAVDPADLRLPTTRPLLGSLGIVLGGFFVLLGTWFLIDEYVPGFDYAFPWPLIVIGLGGLILLSSATKREA